MKKIIITLLLIFPLFAFARAGGGGVHFKNNPPYDCSITKKPSTPKWLTGIKKEKLNDGQITLTWEDSDQAHDVEIKYTKTKKTGDDSREVIKGLKNGKVYTFQVRGVSNCGRSGWSKKYKALP
jgi:hypothetical protein